MRPIRRPTVYAEGVPMLCPDPTLVTNIEGDKVALSRAIAITTEDANKWAFASPDCRVGKHTACSGDAWDQHTDRQINCACPCHTEGLR